MRRPRAGACVVTALVADFAAALRLKRGAPPSDDGDLYLRALDALALALVEHGHKWSAAEHDLYESAVQARLAAMESAR